VRKKNEEGKVISKSGIVEVYVRKPSGRCPQCGEATYPTGGMKRVLFRLQISVSSKPLKKEWRYEKEHHCTRCRRKFGVSQIESWVNNAKYECNPTRTNCSGLNELGGNSYQICVHRCLKKTFRSSFCDYKKVVLYAR